MNSLKTVSFSSSISVASSASTVAFGLLVLEDHAGLFEDGVLDEDRHLGADRQGDGVARARIDLDVAAVGVDDQLGEERLVGQLVDDDLGQLAAELLDDARAGRASAAAETGTFCIGMAIASASKWPIQIGR